MHVYSAEKGKLIAFKCASWEYLQCSERWAKISDTTESKIAINSANLLDIDLNSLNVGVTCRILALVIIVRVLNASVILAK